MKIGFIGLGNLGLPMAYAFKFKGHDVYGYDLNPIRMNPEWFKEKEKGPNGEQSLREFIIKDPINYVSSLNEVIDSSDIVFVTVQTPNRTGHDGTVRFPKIRQNYNLDPIKKCLEGIAKINGSNIIVMVSTVLPGTIREELLPIIKNTNYKFIHNPMFCAMGTVLPDLYNPEFVILGGEDDAAINMVSNFYDTINSAKKIKVGFENAEMIKTCYNGFITMKINYANTVMEMAEKIPGCNSDTVMDALFMAKDRLISTKYLRGGMGDGGGCHPKENSSLSWLAQKLNLSFDWFEMNMACRERQTEWLANIIGERLLTYNYPVFLLGSAFKSETNLEDGSPAILLSNILKERGIKHKVYDPFVERRNDKSGVFDESSIYFISTNHKEFADMVFPDGSIIIDPWRYIPDQDNASVIRIGENH
jgi:UDPglucose 6-dehydrogenase